MVVVIGRISSPRFVGRREELTALEGATSAAFDGAGSAVLIAGSAGIGKSRLIAELVDRAQRSGVTVLMGECPPLGGGELPYAPIVGALRGLVRQHDPPEQQRRGDAADDGFSQLLPHAAGPSGNVIAGLAVENTQARLFEQILALLVAMTRDSPVALVIEDLHWADRSTRDFLAFLVRAARPERLVLIGSYRSDEVHGRKHPVRPFMHELERSGQATRVELAPFSRSEVHEQITAILDAPPDRALVDRLFERSEGNPFFTEELLASSSAGGGLPDSLRDALLWRLDGRPAAVQDVLRIAATAGRTLDHDLLAAVAGMSDTDLTAALRDAVDTYVLAHDPASSGYSFRHTLVREAIYADLLPGERRDLHRALALALAERRGPAGAPAAAELAYHWYAAGEHREALAASITAGLAAEAVHAFGDASVHYERAMEAWNALGDSVPELAVTRLELIRRAAYAARVIGAYDRAVPLARDVVDQIDERSDPAGAALAHAYLGYTVWVAGRGEDDALVEYARAEALMPAQPPSADRAYVLGAQAQILLFCNRRRESAALCGEALQICEAVDAPAVQAHVLNTACPNLTSLGEFERAVSAADRARAIARALGLVEEIGRSYVNGSDALDHAGRVEESIALAREGIEGSRGLGIERRFGDCLRCEVASRLMRTTRWSEAETLLGEVVDRNPVGLNALMAYEYLGHLHAERGQFDDARRMLSRSNELLQHIRSSVWIAPITESQATVELWAGRPADAATLIAACLSQVDGSEYVLYTARLYELGARACAELAAAVPGDLSVQRTQAAVADSLLERLDGLRREFTGSDPPRVAASRASCAAERSRLFGAGDPVLWAEAERLWAELGDQYLAAYARWRQAEAVLSANADRRQVEGLVRAAHRVATELGARPLRDELVALARTIRLDLHDGDGDRAGAGPATFQHLELTAREIEVLTLVADGMTNRQIATRLFISNKTASSHVSHILSKLSVPNRTAAAATARRLGLGRDD
jgi:ATP/maltotriose-dependent transcriptional regulator MalT